MLKSIAVGIGVAFALPVGWLLLWRLGIVSLGLPRSEDKAISVGAVAGVMAEYFVRGLVLGLITALLLYFLRFRRA